MEKEPMNNKKRTLITALCAFAFLLVIVISAAISMRGSSLFRSKKSQTEKGEISSEASDEDDSEDDILSPYGVFLIEEIDHSSSGITLFGLETGTKLMLRYTPGSDVRNSYGKIISTELLRPGLYCTIGYSSEAGTLSKMTLSDGIWRFRRVTKAAIDRDLKKITLSGSIYRYDDSLHVFSDGNLISLDDVSADDILTICGIDKYMYSIEVTRGHGTLSLCNEEDYIDCRLFYDLETYTVITQDMSLSLPEGRYDIKILDGPMEVDESVIISRGKNTTLNLFKYASVALPHGNLHLNITPSDADIFVDGVYYEDPDDIRITYGDHELLISADDYTDYEGSVSIASADTTVNIALTADPFAGFFTTDDYDDEDDYDYFYGADDDDTDDDDAYENPYGEHTSDKEPNIYVSRSLTEDQPEDDTSSDKEDSASGSSSTSSGSDSSSASENGSGENNDKKGETSAASPSNGNNGKHKTTLNFAHDGAEVYLNDTYAGTIRNGSLTIGKIPGIYDVSFYIDGSEYSTFTIEVGDGDEDDVFSFPG